jgi:hypothetical protein
MKIWGLTFLFAATLFALAPSARAHVGSKDVFETVQAGPYTLYVTIRPPLVIPGIATVEIRCEGAIVSAISITPLPVTGEAAKHPPASDAMQQNATDHAFFTGSVWIMAGGTWQVRMEVEGSAGHQIATVPVVAVPIAVLKMDRSLGIPLALLGLFLVISLAAVIAASFREARLAPGAGVTASLRRRGFIAFGAALAVLAFAVYGGGWWWNVEAADYADHVFVPAQIQARLSGSTLDLMIPLPPPEKFRRARPLRKDSFLPDHGHLMHLYAIRWPQMDAAFHLHPTLVETQDGRPDFREQLPAMPPGEYRLFGDVVHASGFPETLLATVAIPSGVSAAPLSPEDASAMPAPLSAGMLGTSYKLPDGYTMVWDKPAAITANTAYGFRFTLLDPTGKPTTDMQPYLGMAGHAAFVKSDGTVFAHTHPDGSAAMPDVMLANESIGSTGSVPEMPGMDMSSMPMQISPTVTFPYGFPSSGRYRIFIQMKHGKTVETGVFDVDVK